VVLPVGGFKFVDKGREVTHARVPLEDDFVDFGITIMDGRDGPYCFEMSYMRALPNYDIQSHVSGRLSSRRTLPSAAVDFFKKQEQSASSGSSSKADSSAQSNEGAKPSMDWGELDSSSSRPHDGSGRV